MSILAENKGGNFEVVAAGNHLARCYSMVQIGTIHDETFDTKRHLVRITWELPLKKKVFKPENGERPFSISKEYTLSMNEKANLRQDLESWRGKGFTENEAKAFDITKLLGKACMLNVIHKQNRKGNTYAVISSITPIPEGMTCPAQINPTFELSYSDWSDSKFNSLPDFIKERMQQTPEFQSMLSGGGEVLADRTEPEDDLPF